MKKEDLIAQGLTEEQAKYVMENHGKAVTTLNSQIATLQQSETDLKSQMADRDKDLSKLKKEAKDNAELSQQYKNLENKYKADQKAHQEKLDQIKFDGLLTESLTGSKVRNAKAVKGLLDLDKLAIADDKDELLGFEDQIKAIQESDPYLFDMGKGSKGYDPKGGGTPSPTYSSFEEAMEKGDVDTFLKQEAERKEE